MTYSQFDFSAQSPLPGNYYCEDRSNAPIESETRAGDPNFHGS